MGSAIAARLAGLGHEVAVWNRTAAKARALGLPVGDSPQALVSGSEAVITLLTDAAAVDTVYARLLSGNAKGRLFIDMSTVRPEVSRRIFSLTRGKSASFVECPVGGSVGPAREGKLFGFAGGEVRDVERARPLLEQMCRRVEHVGPAGAGAAMKLAVNLPLLVYWQALGEALSLVQPLNLEPARVMDILADTSGAPAMLKPRAATIAAALAGSEPSAVSVDIDTMSKDLREMVAEARSLGARLPVTERALACFEEISASGLGAKDCSFLPAAWLRTLSKSRPARD